MKLIETTVPLYLSNICDSNCLICNMRKTNENLIRKSLSKHEIVEQLRIIRITENISSLLILTGELKLGRIRKEQIDRVIFTVLQAECLGFEKISLNIGSLTEEEIKLIYNSVLDKNLGLSVFQESYNLCEYEKYFGYEDKNVPKSDFDFRLKACERWIKTGFKRVNIGILLGLGDVDSNVEKLIEHYKKLLNIGGHVEISLPRVIGNMYESKNISDTEFIDIVKYVSKVCNNAKIILTTREAEDIIVNLIDYIDVVSPGTSDIGGYTTHGLINNNPNSSQFSVHSKRKRPSWVLDSIMEKANINKIKYYKEDYTRY